MYVRASRAVVSTARRNGGRRTRASSRDFERHRRDAALRCIDVPHAIAPHFATSPHSRWIAASLNPRVSRRPREVRVELRDELVRNSTNFSVEITNSRTVTSSHTSAFMPPFAASSMRVMYSLCTAARSMVTDEGTRAGVRRPGKVRARWRLFAARVYVYSF